MIVVVVDKSFRNNRMRRRKGKDIINSGLKRLVSDKKLKAV